jgi:hypothetical protein
MQIQLVSLNYHVVHYCTVLRGVTWGVSPREVCQIFKFYKSKPVIVPNVETNVMETQSFFAATIKLLYNASCNLFCARVTSLLGHDWPAHTKIKIYFERHLVYTSLSTNMNIHSNEDVFDIAIIGRTVLHADSSEIPAWSLLCLSLLSRSIFLSHEIFSICRTSA